MRVLVTVAVLLFAMGCESKDLPVTPSAGLKRDVPLDELYRPQSATGDVYYRLRYKQSIDSPSSTKDRIYIFDVLESVPNRSSNEMTLEGRGVHLEVGAIVECRLPARDLGRCIDAPIDSYWKRPAQDILAAYLASGK